MSIIKQTSSVFTFDISIDSMKSLIAKDLGVSQESIRVEYIIGDLGPGDPMDRFDPPRGVVGIRVYQTVA